MIKRINKEKQDSVTMKAKDYTHNVWSYNLRNYNLQDKIVRSLALANQKNYPKTSYSPQAGCLYDGH